MNCPIRVPGRGTKVSVALAPAQRDLYDCDANPVQSGQALDALLRSLGTCSSASRAESSSEPGATGRY